MPRPPKATWIPPRPGRGGGFWITRAFGEFSEKTGRRKGIKNHDIGPPTGRDAVANKAAAGRWVEGLVAAEAVAVRRGDNPTVLDLADAFCDWSSREVTLRTVKSHAERLRTFCRFKAGSACYGDRDARGLRPADLARFIKAMKAEGKAPGYINTIIESVNAMLNWAARPVDGRTPEQILAANPFVGVARPKRVVPPARYCGPEARSAFLGYARQRACAQKVGTMARRFDRLTVQLLRLCESSGCRPGEACRLEWGHINWQEGKAILRGKMTGRTAKHRVVPLTDSTLRILRAIGHLPGRHERFVFTHQARDSKGLRQLAGLPWTGNAIQHKIRQWRNGAIKAGLPIAAEGAGAFTLYAYRRDMGADVLRMTGSFAASAEVLGHTVAMNERYYSSFTEEYPVNLAREVEEKRRAKDP
jgi:integrase